MIGVDVLIWLLPVELIGDSSGISVVDGEIRRGPRFLSAYGVFGELSRHCAGQVRTSSLTMSLSTPLQINAAGQLRWRESMSSGSGFAVSTKVATSREVERGDRPPGQARPYADRVHQGIEYDIDVDTTNLSLEDAVATVVGLLPARWHVAARLRTDVQDALPPRSAWGTGGTRSLAP